MTALDEQRVVEFEADRRTPDHFAVDVSKQPGRLDPAIVEGATAAVVLNHLHELAERLTLSQKSEDESFSSEFALGREHLGFVGNLRQPEAKTHHTILAGTTATRSPDSRSIPNAGLAPRLPSCEYELAG